MVDEVATVAPGACADPSCPVLHADPANPIHPPDYGPTAAEVEVARDPAAHRHEQPTPSEVRDA